MRLRRPDAKRAEEIRDQAKEAAGRSGEALKEFATETGSAAKEFASKTRDAAKDLVSSIERAAKHVEPERSKGSRKLVIAAVVAGIGAVLVAQDKIRSALSGRDRSFDDPWTPKPADSGNGSSAETRSTESL